MSSKKDEAAKDNVGSGRGKRMSAFAQSAYEHATHESSTPPRHSFMGNLANKIKGKSGSTYDKQGDHVVIQDASPEYNLLYYPDGTIVDGLNNKQIASSNVVDAEFQPLAGTCIVLLTGTSNRDRVGDPHILKIMEERENIGCTIESLGARWVPSLDAAAEAITHAIWIGPDDGPRLKRETIWKQISNDALNKLSICQSMDIRKSLISCMN